MNQHDLVATGFASDGITHCLTIGGRPDLLRRTLVSLAGLPALPTLAINDFGDAETSAVLHELCPEARLVGPGHHLGHHPAVDAMYAEVETPYVFHNEDDWQFSRTDFLSSALRLLEAEPAISAVCFRATADMPLSDADRAKIVTESIGGIRYERLDALHNQWHGYSFNPHLARKSLWEKVGGFSQFEKERHLSRVLRRDGYHVAFLLPEACRHIGDGRSTTPENKSLFKRLKTWLRRGRR